MRDRETIDSELRRLAAERRLLGEHGGELSSRELDRLLDERLGHHPEPDEPDPIAAVTRTRSPRNKYDDIAPYRRKRVQRRFGLPMALPLSLVATVAAAVAMFAIHRAHPTADPAATSRQMNDQARLRSNHHLHHSPRPRSLASSTKR